MYLFRHRRHSRLLALVSPVLGLLALIGLFKGQNDGREHRFDGAGGPCPHLPGFEDIVVVLKTGVTEAREKIPVHFQTTLRCTPNYVIVSDFEEYIDGVHIHDVLRHVEPGLKDNNFDFDLYNRVQEFGRKGLVEADLIQETNGPTGMPDNAGWRLDKWKFLPMIDEVLGMHPNMSWYVFMEADTYVVWPNLVAWLSRLDSHAPYYLGTETEIANVIFAHGGSGIVLSNAAMRMVSEFRATRVVELDIFVDEHWAGDCVLGKVLADAGVNLTFSWPMVQNAQLGEVDALTKDFYRVPWCYPVVDLHHLTPDDIRELSHFDQDWFLKRGHQLLLHCDLFRELIYPALSAAPRRNWDNLSGDPREDPDVEASLKDCEALCRDDPTCQQYSYKLSSLQCQTSKYARLGKKQKGVVSGWMTDRIDAAVDRLGSCPDPEWIL